MLVVLGKAIVAVGVAVAGAKQYTGKKNPSWSNIHW